MPAFDFDISSYEIQAPRSFEPLPPGDYQAMVTSSELKDTKAGDKTGDGFLNGAWHIAK